MTGEAHDDYAWNQRRDEVVITRHGRPATILRRSAALRFSIACGWPTRLRPSS
jgi:hypothetical protein